MTRSSHAGPSGTGTQTGTTTPVTEGYPSWLPRRPSGPGPSTLHSSMAGLPPSHRVYPSTLDALDLEQPRQSSSSSSGKPPPFVGGRRPTPRSVRVVRVQPGRTPDVDTFGRRIPTDATRVNHPHAHGQQHRAWSRATGSGILTPTLMAAIDRPVRPRWHARGFKPAVLRSGRTWERVHWRILPLLVWWHVPVQSFLDFNAVYILLQLARHPNENSAGRPWTLAAIAYIACWAVWLIGIVLLYEIVYLFVRRWRVKRPLMVPLYLSTPGIDMVRMTSFNNFSFVSHIRRAAWSSSSPGSDGEGGTLDGIAEVCWRYSQNLPTVVTLLPRAGVVLAVLLGYWTMGPGVVEGDGRDGTFFRSDGSLTGYARGVLAANVAWAIWRALVLLFAWIGLWIASGQLAAGICGPRYRWEEQEAEKRASVFSASEVGTGTDGLDEPDALPWAWRERTVQRLTAAFVLCSTPDNLASYYEKGPMAYRSPVIEEAAQPTPEQDRFDVERVMAAIGMPSSPQPARRPILSNELFRTPAEEIGDPMNASTGNVKPGSKSATPPLSAGVVQPYPFPGFGSQDRVGVPFPPSPGPEQDTFPEHQNETSYEHDVSHTHEGDEEDEEDEEYADGVHVVYVDASEAASSASAAAPRSSGSMSSLGAPIASRYPFAFRRPQHRRSLGSNGSPRSPVSPSGNTYHTTGSSARTPNTRSGTITTSSGARSGFSQSTGNGESPESVLSQAPASSISGSGHAYQGSIPPSTRTAGIPMPPSAGRRRRARAGTVPASPSPPGMVAPTLGLPGSRVRTDTDTSADSALSGLSSGLGHNAEYTFGPVPLMPPMYDLEERSDNGSHESAGERSTHSVRSVSASVAGEAADAVGLLSRQVSPRSSLANVRSRAESLVSAVTGRSRRSSSNSNSYSGSASGGLASRTHSVIAGIGAASRSSVDVVAGAFVGRLRTDSAMARLEDQYESSSAQESSSGLSSPENHTFGHPLRASLGGRGQDPLPPVPHSPVRMQARLSPPNTPGGRLRATRSAGSVRTSMRTVTRALDSDDDDDDEPQGDSQENTALGGTIRGIPIPSATPTNTTFTLARPPLARRSTTDVTHAFESYVTAPMPPTPGSLTTPTAPVAIPGANAGSTTPPGRERVETEESTLASTPGTTHTMAMAGNRVAQGMYAPFGGEVGMGRPA